jgi:hypothetical protein
VGDGDPEPREIVVSAAVRVGRGHLDEHAVGRGQRTRRGPRAATRSSGSAGR